MDARGARVGCAAGVVPCVWRNGAPIKSTVSAITSPSSSTAAAPREKPICPPLAPGGGAEPKEALNFACPALAPALILLVVVVPVAIEAPAPVDCRPCRLTAQPASVRHISSNGRRAGIPVRIIPP